MAETRFIKTVTFGGYDKNDVDKKLEYLFTQVYELKNELREAKLALEEYKKGTDGEKALEGVLAGERAKLTQVQVRNETMSEKLKAAEDDNKSKEKELEELKAKAEKYKAEADKAKSDLAALSAGSDAVALSTVFIEAQKSAQLLEDTARQKAEQVDKDSKKLAEDTVTEANNKAKKIIFEAESRAAEIDADAKTRWEQMDAASGNLKATLLTDVESIMGEVSKLRTVFEEFEENGLSKLKESEQLLGGAEKRLKAGGIPVFRQPDEFSPEYPDEPEYSKVDGVYESSVSDTDRKKKEELEKLQAMASSIGGKSTASDDGVDLASLAEQAAALGGDESGSDAKKSNSGGIDLAALAAQAAALED